jgi:hypothetical protein
MPITTQLSLLDSIRADGGSSVFETYAAPRAKQEIIREDVRHDERLKDGNLVHAFPDALQRPLLLDWGAEENKDEGEDDAPEYDNRHAGENPVSDMDCKYPHVEEELTELQAS